MTTTTDSTSRGLGRNVPGLLALGLACGLAVTTEMLPVGLLPHMGRTFDVPDSVTGLLVGLYAVMVAALAVPLTIATAGFARKPLLLTTVLCYAVSNTVVALAPTFAVVAIGRTLGGLTHALFFSLCIGYAPRLVAPAHVGRALTLTQGGTSTGFVLGVPLSTSLGTAFGWRTSFGVLALLAGVTLVLLARLLPAVDNQPPPRRDENSSGNRELAAVVASNALTYLGQFTLYTFISVVLLTAGARPTQIGPLLLVCGACGLLGLWYTGNTLDRNPRQAMLVVLGVSAAAILALGAAFPTLAAVVLTMALWNGAFGGAPSLYQSCAVRTRAVAPEVAGAWVNATANIGIAGGAAIGAGLLPIVGLGGLPWVSASLIGLGLAVGLAARRAVPSRV